jgi:hypothetical protein
MTEGSMAGGISMMGVAFRSTDVGRTQPAAEDHGSVTFPCLEWLGCRAAQRREHDRQTSHPATAVKKTRADHHG